MFYQLYPETKDTLIHTTNCVYDYNNTHEHILTYTQKDTPQKHFTYIHIYKINTYAT